jgi:hypothetical protein
MVGRDTLNVSWRTDEAVACNALLDSVGAPGLRILFFLADITEKVLVVLVRVVARPQKRMAPGPAAPE